MKKTIGAIFLIIISFHLYAQPSTDTSSSKTLIQKLDEFLTSLSNAHQFNGSVLIAQKGQILLDKGYGWKNAATNTFNEPNCIFQIGSLTKPFTATIILKLQEEGKLSVSDKLSKYFTDYPNGKKITIENLLTHTSGIFSFDVDEQDTIAWKPVPQNEVLNVFKNKPLDFKPGTKFQYSNSGYFLLGMIIEKVTGKPYEQVVREMIFEPLQMKHSGFDFIHLMDTAKATGYSILNDTLQRPAHLIDSTVSYSAGAIYSSTADLYKWAKAIANGKVLSPNTWNKAFTPYKENYGYGWFIDSMNGKNYVGHSGGIMGFSSYYTYFNEDDVIIILLSNLLNEANPTALPIQDLSAIIFNKPYSIYHVQKSVLRNDSIINNYIGTYYMVKIPKRHLIISKEENHLIATLNKKTRLEIVFQADRKFHFKELPTVDGEFILTNGKVTKIIFHQNGLFEWNKIK